MFMACIPFLILTRVVVFGLSVDKLSTDILEYFEVSAFVFDNDSIRLNITWDDNFNNSILGIFVENNDVESECFYPYEDTYDLNDHNALIPSLNISNPVDEILLGCSYNINLILEKLPLSYVYQVPDCIGNYCTCITNETNLIKLIKVQNIEDQVFKVKYTSYNTSVEKGNFYITEIFYVKENTANYFEVPVVKYAKGEFEICMEYINEGQNYTLYVNYRDSNNANPQCDYTSKISFKAQVVSATENYLLLKVVLTTLLFLFSLLILYGFLRWSRYSTKTIEGLKKYIFSTHEDPQIIKNLKTSSLRCLHQEINALYTPLEILEAKNRPINLDPYEFPPENIIIKDVIGEGAFGKVYYAKAYKLNGIPGFTMVAVKQLRGDAPKEELAGFQDEIKMLKKIGVHKNIVKLLACVTRTQPYMMVMELVSTGDLKEYLLKLREIWITNKNKRRFFPDDMEEKLRKSNGDITRNEEPNNNSETSSSPKPPLPRTPGTVPSKQALSEGITSFDVDTQTPLLSDIGGRPDPVLDHQELENFALQIATGMAYLEQIPVTHRDLAARNILITKDKTLKISDFGMSRTGPYVNRHLKKMPLRWMAIESVEEFKADNKSDVWSFGVVLWEIGTLGAFPYEKIPNELLIKALKAGHRLPRPEICTDELYALMQKCWMENPKDRPSFGEVVEHLRVKKQHVYVDFNKVNPTYVFPPTDPKT